MKTLIIINNNTENIKKLNAAIRICGLLIADKFNFVYLNNGDIFFEVTNKYYEIDDLLCTLSEFSNIEDKRVNENTFIYINI